MFAYAGMALAACTGVLLAAIDSPNVRDHAVLQRISVVLLSAGAAVVAGATISALL